MRVERLMRGHARRANSCIEGHLDLSSSGTGAWCFEFDPRSPAEVVLQVDAQGQAGSEPLMLRSRLVFPQSGTGEPLSQAEIDPMGAQAFQAWGGRDRLREAIALCRE